MELTDLSYLTKISDRDPRSKRYNKLNEALVDLIHDFDLVGFRSLNIMDKYSVHALLADIDQANGYEFVTADRNLLELVWKRSELQSERYPSSPLLPPAAFFFWLPLP